MDNIVLLGAPGSGKGTQAERLCQETGLRHLATGDLFRLNLKHETEVGRLAARYMAQGELVPNKVTMRMVQEWLSDHRGEVSAGILFDGFPRNIEQTLMLQDLLEGFNQTLDGVVYLAVKEEVIIKRLSGRLICRQCQAPFHKVFHPFVACPTKECESGEYLYQRDDDQSATWRMRIETFHQETAPVIDFYRGTGLLHEVDAEGTINEVKDRVSEAIKGI